MSGQFFADPTALEQNGNKILENGSAFKESIQTIYNTVDDMVANDYVSIEAKEIAKKIESYRADMDILTKTISDYGTFLLKAANAVRNNQGNIIDNIN